MHRYHVKNGTSVRILRIRRIWRRLWSICIMNSVAVKNKKPYPSSSVQEAVSYLNCTLVRNSVFAICPHKFFSANAVPSTSASLRAASTQDSITDGYGQGFVQCVYIRKCNRKRCVCHRKNILCNNKYYAGWHKVHNKIKEGFFQVSLLYNY